MEFTIREARPGDEHGWVDIAWARWHDTYGHHLGDGYFTQERRANWLSGWAKAFTDAQAAAEARQSSGEPPPENPTRRYVAEDGSGRIVGIALAGPPATQGHPMAPVMECELHILYVSVDAQGTGVAQALTDAVLPDNQPAQLWVSADNHRAHAFYRKVGFAPDGAEGMYNGMIPEIRMVRGA
ncbi:MAG: GNAT family N-acetyltransferase [bacterium]|nr:GNAT family N-acetyltransferase [bacterium]